MAITNVEVTSHVIEVKKALEDRVPVILEALGLQAEGNAITEVSKAVYDTPASPTYVRTGNLRNSLTHRVDEQGKAVYVGSNIEYAPYVEMGTKKMPARPFIRPTVEKSEYKDQYNEIVERLMQG